MEAAGIEPASRDISMTASTRVVDYLSLAELDENRHPASSASRELVLTSSVLDMTQGDLELATGFWISPAKIRSQGYVVTQPVRGFPQQLKLFGQLLTWPTDQPRHATGTSTIRSNPVHPPLLQINNGSPHSVKRHASGSDGVKRALRETRQYWLSHS